MRLPTSSSILAGAVLYIAATAASGQTDTHSAVTPAPSWNVERHQAMNERVGQGNVDLIFIGDSITQGWEGSGAGVWEKHFAPRNAVNLGISGERTQHVLWRLANGNIDGISPKVAVIMIGTNNSNGTDNTATEIADGITAIVMMLRERLPQMRIILLDVFPRGRQPNPQRGKILQVNQMVRKLHDGEHVHYHAIGHHFIEPDGSISKEIMPDALHLSERGYEIWAEAIDEKVTALMEAAPATATESLLPPTPEGWRYERLEIPPGFAPDLPYTGFEELRFAPGMFDPASDSYFSYVFALRLDGRHEVDTAFVKSFLEKYYGGLCRAVAGSRDLDLDLSTFTVKVAGRGDRFAAAVNMFDPFTDGSPLVLELEVLAATTSDRTDMFALAAPNTAGAAMWKTLHDLAAQWWKMNASGVR